LEAQTRHIIECLEEAAAGHEVTVDGVTTKARVESHVTREYHAMDVSDDSRVVRLVKDAARRMGLEVKTMASGGGCDANIFNKRGIECANLGTGMRAIHTVKEWLDVKDMYASAEMTLEIMRLNGEMARSAAGG
jgi:tripeptide aminopeptidase